jgi:hypothetical protein
MKKAISTMLVAASLYLAGCNTNKSIIEHYYDHNKAGIENAFSNFESDLESKTRSRWSGNIERSIEKKKDTFEISYSSKFNDGKHEQVTYGLREKILARDVSELKDGNDDALFDPAIILRSKDYTWDLDASEKGLNNGSVNEGMDEFFCEITQKERKNALYDKVMKDFEKSGREVEFDWRPLMGDFTFKNFFNYLERYKTHSLDNVLLSRFGKEALVSGYSYKLDKFDVVQDRKPFKRNYVYTKDEWKLKGGGETKGFWESIFGSRDD